MKRLIRTFLGGAMALSAMVATAADSASPQSALAGWLTQLSDAKVWKTGVLGGIADDCKKEFSSADAAPSARLHRALATLLEVGETKAAQDFFKKFGYTVDYSNVGKLPETLLDLAKWPTANACIDDAYPTLKAALDSARDDLAGIPDDWTGTVRLPAADYPIFDEDVYVDVGDVQYLRSFLAAREGSLLYMKAQNIANDSAKLKADLTNEKVATLSSAPTVSSAAWNGVAPLAFKDADAEATNLFSDVKVAICGNTFYVRLKKGPALAKSRSFASQEGMEDYDRGGNCWIGFYASLKEGLYSGEYLHVDAQTSSWGYRSSYTSDWDSDESRTFGDIGWRTTQFGDSNGADAAVVVEETDEAMLFEVDCSPAKLSSNKAFRGLADFEIRAGGGYWWSRWSGETNEWDDFREYYSADGDYDPPYTSADGAWRVFNNQPKVFDRVRDASLLKTSKTLMEEALQLAKKADKSFLARRDDLLHLFEYDADDEEALRVMRENVNTAIASLSSSQKVDRKNILTSEQLSKFRGRDALDNPLDVYLGALFSGKVLRTLVPPSASSDGYLPNLGAMKDPTMGGLFPKATVAKWKKLADAYGVEYADSASGGTDDGSDGDAPSAPDVEASYGPFVPGEKVELELPALVGWAAKGLPGGLKFNAKTGAVTGTPTKQTADGGATVTFSKKNATSVTTQFVVGPVPVVSVTLAGGTNKCSVAGAGKAYLAGKKVTLTAKAPKGTAFVGWTTADGAAWPDAENASVAKQTFEMPAENLALVATFKEEEVSLACTALAEGSFTVGVSGDAANGLPIEVAADSDVKSVKASKLPGGLKLVKDKETGEWSIVGTPTKAGSYEVVLTVTTAAGSTRQFKFPVTVAPLPSWAVGTFTGVCDIEGDEGDEEALYVSLTVAANGKLSGTVVYDTDEDRFATAAVSAKSMTGYDAESGSFYYDVILPFKDGKEVVKKACRIHVFSRAFDGSDERLKVGSLQLVFDGGVLTTTPAAQNVWKDKSFADKPVFAAKNTTVTKEMPIHGDDEVVDGSVTMNLVISQNGSVAATFVIEGEDCDGEFYGRIAARKTVLVVTDRVNPEDGGSAYYVAEVPLVVDKKGLRDLGRAVLELRVSADSKVHEGDCEITYCTDAGDWSEY